MRLAKWASSLTLIVAVTLPALAQDRQRPGPGRFGGGGLGGLLQRDEVKKELAISDDQATKLKEIGEKVRESMKGDFEKLKDASREERREKMAEIASKSRGEWMKAIGDVLKPEQQKRLLQIEIQHAGEGAFSLPEVEKALKLSDTQKDKMKTVREDARKEIQKLMEDTENRRGNFEKVAEIRKGVVTKIEEILDEDQKKALKELKGEAFELKRMERRRDINNPRQRFRQRNKSEL